MGFRVGAGEGWSDGMRLTVGMSLGTSEGLWLGARDGDSEGERLGNGDTEGRDDGALEGSPVGSHRLLLPFPLQDAFFE